MCPVQKKVKDKEEKLIFFPGFKFILEKNKAQKLHPKLSLGSECFWKNTDNILIFLLHLYLLHCPLIRAIISYINCTRGDIYF